MGDKIGDRSAARREKRASGRADAHEDRDSGGARAPSQSPKLHMTGRGLSPAEYLAQHGSHDHQADFSADARRGPEPEGAKKKS